VANVLHAQLLNKVLMFLTRNRLCKAVSRHLSSRFPLDSDSSNIYLLAKPHLMDVDMAKLCLNVINIALRKAYSLRIVTPEILLVVKCKADIAAEAIPVL
jgi:hypothetical protein